MGVADWRAWTAQNSAGTGGGTMPTAPNPPGTPYVTGVVFPGVNPIGVGVTPGPPGTQIGLIDGAQSFPTYANTPITINAVDPFAGWVDQKEFAANSGGAQTPTMRPAIPGLTSP
jgi:hypothetical protein